LAYVNFVSQDDLPENNFDIGIDELDCPFTEEELGKTISTLIRNKSCGIDNIVADFFIDAKSFMVPYLVTIFVYLYICTWPLAINFADMPINIWV